MPTSREFIDEVKITITGVCSNQTPSFLSDRIQLNWPTNQSVLIEEELKSDSDILIILANNKNAIKQHIPLFIKSKEQKIPLVIISDFDSNSINSEENKRS